MHYEPSMAVDRPARERNAGRVWEGTVHGVTDWWVVVARDERELEEWVVSEQEAVEVAPLRVCRAIVGDDSLVIGAGDGAMTPRRLA